ncbi:Wee1-like protein kinase 2 [Thelohanellus kitauei]|uniref:Wee1-like protein kinase 2 n=1 Tax=Thelohanellus kitauei TaxID=669202 RepID=A0A0C2JY69_THEKT|nr:Wee1-like protein kinase 2 [Thelohanellus kitauei]
MLDRTLIEPLNEQLDAERLCTIGNGDTGRAVKCRDKDGSFFVLKCYSKIISGAFDLARNIKEAAALSKLHHFNVVRYLDSFVHENYLYVKIEYCSGLNLRSIIDKYLENETYPPESDIKSFLSQIVGALHHIHAQGIIHYDIKPDNIFTVDFNLCTDNNNSSPNLPQMIYKIGDFGQCFIPGLLNIEVCEGDSRYIGRETLEFIDEHLSVDRESSFFPSPFSDIFALGLTTAEYCICGDLPSFGVEWHTIRNGNLPMISDQYSPALIDLLTAMIRNEPTNRPSAETILNCPYLNS